MKIFLILPLLISCSAIEKNKNSSYKKQLSFKSKIYDEEKEFLEKHEKSRVVSSANTKEQLSSEEQENILYLPDCDGCIIGSSSAHPKEAAVQNYEIQNGEHLNLDNTYFDFPIVVNEHVEKWLSYFQGKGKGWYKRAAERAGRYAPILSDILSENGLPRDLIYLAFAESGFQNAARSWALAVGPWQFIKRTGERYGLKIGWYVDERMDPIKASLAAAKYLRDLHQKFGDWSLAMAGYNAGEGKVAKALKKYNAYDFWGIRKGRYLRQETKDYVPKIMALAIIGKNLKRFGFEREISFQKSLEYDIVPVKAETDLYQLANAMNLSFDELKKWNPELLRWQTPYWRDGYPLRVPVGMNQVFMNCCEGVSFYASDYKTLDIKKSASIPWLSKKYKVPRQVLAHLNDTGVNKHFTKGDVVKLPFKSGHNRFKGLYKDLYIKKKNPWRKKKKGLSMRQHIKMAMKKGSKISNPKSFYTVKKGDNLWNISRKTGVSIHTLIKSNLSQIKKGRVHPGQKIIIR